ncbi:alpha/beta hydrolase [Winogradskyella sp. UBA3174]|uniref:alpha/beta hydrolase n=1 Tax=Winogradskyella sp. UBA3174 TaxID=1947785 RepID=UPI0025E2D44A|nr:esterase [Winogradskyella sp. UBA3174]|tara:strand:- start:5775 stop:6416 length:642 start_codon:yes stop_codon:yes gene_type:complete
MNSQEKEITYHTNNSYSTLNTLTNNTKTVWFVCHGMGYLSQYFLRYFKSLNSEENYIIAPQAPSKYYIQPKMHVGANWLTRNNTDAGMANILNYFDAILDAEQIPKSVNLIVFGYSQGVSVAMRYLAKRQLQCSQLVIHSGGIPKELSANDFSYLDANTKVKLIYGTEDEYLDNTRVLAESERATALFGNRLTVLPFKGKHVVNVGYINDLVK